MKRSDYGAELFSDEQIAQALEDLGDYEKYEDAATLAAGVYDPAVIEIFTKLARVLGTTVTSAYGGMKIMREKPLSERRAATLRSLQDAAEQGTIIPAQVTFLPGEKEDDIS